MILQGERLGAKQAAAKKKKRGGGRGEKRGGGEGEWEWRRGGEEGREGEIKRGG